MQAELIALSTAIATVGGVVGSLLVAWATKRKTDAETESASEKSEIEQEQMRVATQAAITKQATDLLIPYREELARYKSAQDAMNQELYRQASELKTAEARYSELSCRFERLQNDYATVVAGARKLVLQIKAAGLSPVWTPDD